MSLLVLILLYMSLGLVWLSLLGVANNGDFGVSWIKDYITEPTALKVLFVLFVLTMIWCPLVLVVCLDNIFKKLFKN